MDILIARRTQVKSRRLRCWQTSLMLVAILLLAGVCHAWQGEAAAQDIVPTFSFDPETSEEDALLIEESVRFAQDFFIEELGVPIDRGVHVTSLPGIDPQNNWIVAFSMGRSIIVYPNSPGWLQSSPVEKVATVVHEYVHFYQYLVIGMPGMQNSAAWLDEGVAEFVAYTALDQAEIVDRASIEAWNTTQLTILPPNRPLSDFEVQEAFAAADWASYPYAFLAVSELGEDRGFAAIDEYYRLIASGVAFSAAFSTAFGISPDDFYTSFGGHLESMSGATAMPDALTITDGEALTSPVRLVEIPDSINAGTQLLVRARTIAASDCTLAVFSETSDTPLLERMAFADGNGDVFWLATLPQSVPPGTAIITVDCGQNLIESPIPVIA